MFYEDVANPQDLRLSSQDIFSCIRVVAYYYDDVLISGFGLGYGDKYADGDKMERTGRRKTAKRSLFFDSQVVWYAQQDLVIIL